MNLKEDIHEFVHQQRVLADKRRSDVQFQLGKSRRLYIKVRKKGRWCFFLRVRSKKRHGIELVETNGTEIGIAVSEVEPFWEMDD